MIRKDDNGGMRPWMQQMLGVDIFVFEKDVKKAEGVLHAMKEYLTGCVGVMCTEVPHGPEFGGLSYGCPASP
jgi:hypothetical protein